MKKVSVYVEVDENNEPFIGTICCTPDGCCHAIAERWRRNVDELVKQALNNNIRIKQAELIIAE